MVFAYKRNYGVAMLKLGICSLLTVFLLQPVYAFDPTSFLVDPDFAVVEGSQPVKTEGSVRETWTAKDSYGNSYELILDDPAVIQREVLKSMLTRTLGVPATPYYPVLVKRDAQGVPSGTQTAGDGEWLPAILKAKFVFPPDQMLSDFVGEALIELLTAGQGFDPLFERLKGNGILQMKGLAEGKEGFAENLNRYLSRLEQLDLSKFPGLPPNATELRAQFRNQLADFFKENKLRTPVQIDSPFVSIPEPKWNGDAATFSGLSSIEKLWALFMEPRASKRSAALATLSGNSAMSELRQKAVTTTLSFYGVYHNSAITKRDAPTDEPAQVSLNTLNTKTLVVVPLNDAEAYAIARISKAAGAKVLELPDGHGVKLNPTIVSRIRYEVILHDIERVIIVETPPAQGDPIERQLRDQLQIPVIVADHHDYGADKRWKPRSSLAQVAAALGFQMGRTTRAIGIHDGNFFFGLRDFGLSPAEVFAWEPQERDLQIKSGRYETRFGPLLILKDAGGKIGEIAWDFARLTWPKVPTVILLDEQLKEFRISGNPELIAGLLKLWSEFEVAKPAYAFGDPLRSKAGGFKSIPHDLWPEVKAKTLEFLQVAADQPKPLDMGVVEYVSVHEVAHSKGLAASASEALQKLVALCNLGKH